jgi:hypothetical protein
MQCHRVVVELSPIRDNLLRPSNLRFSEEVYSLIFRVVLITVRMASELRPSLFAN